MRVANRDANVIRVFSITVPPGDFLQRRRPWFDLRLSTFIAFEISLVKPNYDRAFDFSE